MTRYRKKPVEVDAWQVGSDEPMPEWIQMIRVHEIPNPIVRCGDDIWYEVHDGEWIIKETEYDREIFSAGGFFEANYEVIE